MSGMGNERSSVDKTTIIFELLAIFEELDARNSSFNSIYENFHGVGWDDLCDKGIDLLNQLKSSNVLKED